MNKVNAKSLTTLRQKLKKYLRDFEKEVEDYRQSPDDGDIDDEFDADDGKFKINCLIVVHIFA